MTMELNRRRSGRKLVPKRQFGWQSCNSVLWLLEPLSKHGSILLNIEVEGGSGEMKPPESLDLSVEELNELNVEIMRKYVRYIYDATILGVFQVRI